MEIIKNFTFPKDLAYPESNEDYFVFSQDGLSSALSDGASESFDSKKWAQSLCNTFVDLDLSQLDFSSEDSLTFLFDKARAQFNIDYSTRELSWSQQLSFERGNFATLVGVEESEEFIKILSIGDSLALWFDPSSGFESHFIRNSEEFNERPLLVSSIKTDDEHFFSCEKSKFALIELDKSCLGEGILYLMSDAIASHLYILLESNKQDEVRRILNLDEEAFRSWIIESRSLRTLKVDDTTLVAINFNEPTKS